MITGLLLLFAPAVAYLVSLPVSQRFTPFLRWSFRIVGGIVVFGGSSISLYFAAYTGDQGGIAAFFFQLFVIAAFALFAAVFFAIHWSMRKRSQKPSGE